MAKSFYYIFTAISFALVIAAPGRFAFGLIVCLELFFLLFFGLMFSFISKKLHLEELNSIFTVVGLIFSTVLYKQIIMCIFPLIALQLSFVFYLPAVSSYMISAVYKNIQTSTKLSVIDNFKFSSCFSIISLVIYILRDILGYGTFTLPSVYGLKEIVLFNVEPFSWATMLVSIPGALLFVSAAILFVVFVQKRFKIITRAEDSVLAGDKNDSE